MTNREVSNIASIITAAVEAYLGPARDTIREIVREEVAAAIHREGDYQIRRAVEQAIQERVSLTVTVQSKP